MTKMTNRIKRIKSSFEKNINNLRMESHNTFIFVMYGLIYDMVVNLHKPFTVKFLERLGGNEFHISLYNSLPGLMAFIALIPIVLSLNKFKSQKEMATIFLTISRTFILLLAVSPLIIPEYRPIVFVVAVSLMHLPDAISQSTFQSFLGSAFDGKERAKAIALRNQFGNIFVLVVTMITGIIMRFVPQNDKQTIVAYQIFYVLAFVAGLWEIRTFLRFDGKTSTADEYKESTIMMKKQERRVNKRGLKTVFSDKKFVSFLIIKFVFYFTWQAGWPIISSFKIFVLEANELWLALGSAAAGVAAFFSANYWRRRIWNKGNDDTFTFAAFCIAISILLFGFAPNVIVFVILQSFNGFATIGVNTCLLNGLLEITPEKDRLMYVGVYNAVTNLSLIIAPFAAYFFMTNVGIRESLFIIGFLRLVTVGIIILQARRKPKEA